MRVAELTAVTLCVLLVIWAVSFFLSRAQSDASRGGLTTVPQASETQPEEIGLEGRTGDDAVSLVGRPVDYKAGQVLNTEDVCPVRLPPECIRTTHTQRAVSESWRATSMRQCCDVARDILLNLQEDGFELVKAGFLDISGEAWGCTVVSAQGETMVITLVPQTLGLGIGQDNRLQITITHIGVPGPEVLEGSGL